MSAVNPQYQRHARRVDALRQIAAPLPASYWQGYRHGMIRWLAESEGAWADSSESAALEALADRALLGQELDPHAAARGCGYADGRQWEIPASHRGMLQLIASDHGSTRNTATALLDLDEGTLRQIVAGARAMPLRVHQRALDYLIAWGAA